MLHKRFDILEAKADVETGTLEATVAVFNNVDFGGDRILPGAFTKSLEAWRASGDPIPVIFNHDWADANAHIGIAHPDDVVETDKGLFVKAHLDVEDNQVAKQVHKLLKRRSIKEFSFGYDVPKGGQKRAKDGANELSEVTLFEVGPTLKGMNPATELHAVKSAVEEENKPPPDETEIRRELERHKAEEATEDVVKAEPGPSELERLTETVVQLGESLEAVKAQVEQVPDPPSESQIRQELVKHTVAEEIKDVPKGDPALSPVEILSQHVEALTDQIGEMAKALDEKLKALEAAVEEPKRANSVVDQRFRKEAAMTVVEVDSDGASFSKPPKQEPEPEREAEWSLKARARREIYDLLSD